MSKHGVNVQPVLMGPERCLFGHLTTPAEIRSDLGVIFFNAGLLHNVGPFRLYVNMADRLAESGIPSLRIDQSGTGESPPRPGVSIDETVKRDYADSFSVLEKSGVSRTVIVGLCSGADDSLKIAADAPGLCGLVLLDGYAKKNLRYYATWYGSRMLSARSWKSKIMGLVQPVRIRESGNAHSDLVINIRDWATDSEMVAKYSQFLGGGRQILSVFTGGQNYYNHIGQLRACLQGDISDKSLKEIYFRNSDHTYSIPTYREKVVSEVCRWIEEISDQP